MNFSTCALLATTSGPAWLLHFGSGFLVGACFVLVIAAVMEGRRG